MKIDKPWGYEIILTEKELPYTGKILHVDSGKRSSLQYHDQKTETLTLIRGGAILSLEDETGNLKNATMIRDQGYTILPNKKHRYSAITDCDIVEHSTPEKGNTFRVEDDYHRGTETEADRIQNK
jgi:mannose-6-phosphate isomerase